MNTTPAFRQWLKRAPQPAKLRVDEKHVVRISNHSSRWSEAEQTVMSYNPTVVEALDGKGDVIRAMTLREPEEEELKPQQEAWPASEQAQLAVIITASNDRAASRHENAYKTGFEALKEVIRELQGLYAEALARSARLEAALQREYARQDKPAVAVTDEQGVMTLLGELLPGMMPALLARMQEKPTNGAAPKEQTQ
jgi:hypothetical protein